MHAGCERGTKVYRLIVRIAKVTKIQAHKDLNMPNTPPRVPEEKETLA